MWGDLPPTPNRFPLQVGGGKERREQQRNEEVGCLQALPPAAVAKPGGWKGALGSLGEELLEGVHSCDGLRKHFGVASKCPEALEWSQNSTYVMSSPFHGGKA